MARKIFTDQALQAEFDRTGYVVINLMDDAKVKDLLALYDKIEGVKGTVEEGRNSYELSFFEKDAEGKRRKFEAISAFFMPLLNEYLDRYVPIITNVFNKEHATGEVPIHQNWTFVDEREYTSVSVWCPLQQVSRENGTLEVVPGSHKVIADYRGPSIPWVFDAINDVMRHKYMMPLELQVGQVAVIDDSVIHYSGVNHTHQDRKAIQLIMKPEEVPTIHCYKAPDSNDEIDILEVEDDFFFDFDMWQKPKSGKVVKKVHFPIHKISEAELVERCNQNLVSR
jgi:ectoine hydroxylase-related dioxygenase (phytanoyl-CoA dioxygenase family)